MRNSQPFPMLPGHCAACAALRLHPRAQRGAPGGHRRRRGGRRLGQLRPRAVAAAREVAATRRGEDIWRFEHQILVLDGVLDGTIVPTIYSSST